MRKRPRKPINRAANGGKLEKSESKIKFRIKKKRSLVDEEKLFLSNRFGRKEWGEGMVITELRQIYDNEIDQQLEYSGAAFFDDLVVISTIGKGFQERDRES